MANLWSRLRIGEKIGLSSAVVGALFLLVIWQYHLTMGQAISDYKTLQQVHEAKKDDAQVIARALASADGAAQRFLLHRQEEAVRAFDDEVGLMLQEARDLKRLDAEGQAVGQRIESLVEHYREGFQVIVEAWRIKGLDHNSGLQGAFRETVHRLEDLAGHYKVDSLYNQLLQIRRGEKDLALRRDAIYRQRVLDLVDGFRQRADGSALAPEVKDRLRRELDAYREAFLVFAAAVLSDQDVHGGKGPFREAAHRIEDVITGHLVADMEIHVLQLRRREKDYLLRHDKTYVDMALAELAKVRAAVEESDIAAEEKAGLLSLAEDYRRDFLALVAQNDRIDNLMDEMRQAAGEILPLVADTVRQANQAVAEVSQRINDEADKNAQRMLWIVLAASLLGILLSWVITHQITTSLLRMAGFLDRLACEEPVDRIPTRARARDELNAMAESVNKMADHKANLVAWWKRSVGEVDEPPAPGTGGGPARPPSTPQGG